MNKTTVHISGMHCRSCEILLEDALQLPGVKKVTVSQTKGTAEIEHQGMLDEAEISKAVTEAGYNVGQTHKPWFSRNKADYNNLAKCALLLVALYFVAKTFGLFNISMGTSGNYASLPVVFFVGLTAGLSTCMALVGGLVLGVSARFSEKHPHATAQEKFAPHLFFNLGRIISFFILGGVVGLVGSFLQLSTGVLGMLTILVGISMLLIGAQLLRIFPRLEGVHFSLPTSLSKALGIKKHKEKEYSHKNAFLMGALTFFLPCGFTQAMQLYAMSTGSPIAGALTMGVFALGTAPGLLGIGGLTSIIKGAFARPFFQFAGLVVIILALFNIGNGYNLSGLNLGVKAFFPGQLSAQASDPNVSLENGVQVVRMTQGQDGYSPSAFTLKKGVPVKWVITSKDPLSCSGTIVSSQLGVRKALQAGQNIIEFTPTETGKIKFTCSMGMYTGSFTVVDGSDTQVIGAAAPVDTGSTPQGASCGSKGGCGCGGGARPTTAQQQNSSPVPAVQNAAEQVIKATYTVNSDIVPNKFTVRAGTPVRFEIDAKENGSGCMGSITVPKLTQQVAMLTQGQPVVLTFTPQEPGEYSITCAMGIPRGFITVK